MITSLLFFPEKSYYELPKDHGLQEQNVSIPVPGGIKLQGWFFKAPAPPATLLFLHGNAGNISGRLSKAKGWVERGASVLLMDYRGYGKSEGAIARGSDLIEDARAALDWLERDQKIPPEKIILYGESIGSYPAIVLAGEKKFAGLILEAPLSSLRELAKKHYGGVPDFVLKDFEMENEENIPDVKAPLFIFHGNLDDICPVEMGRALYRAAPSPKELYVVQGGQHNDLPNVAGENFFDYPWRFITKENGLV